ncbi:MAG: cytochrome c3 family protein [candidate division Zixibacteria bacterium]|nr:cytochrome c3 family protein [candidate division Zixibacteria bacterium]
MKNLIITLTILFIASISYAEFVPLSFEKVFEAKYGNVTFDHQTHVDQDCVVCHAAINENMGMNKDFGHGFCKDCHKTDAGPTKCKECHIK